MSIKVGVFDSGAGGLTVLRTLQHVLPSINFIYIEDAAFAPYGGLENGIIESRVRLVCQFLASQSVDAIVIACNTATVTVINKLRAEMEIPLVGIEPAVKTAYSITQCGSVCVLATPNTIKSQRLKQLIDVHQGASETHLLASPTLAHLIDRGQFDSDALNAELDRIADSVQQCQADVLVLACTHYPHVLPQLQSRLRNTQIIEPSEGVARRLKSLLEEKLSIHSVAGGEIEYFSTGNIGRGRHYPAELVLINL